MFKQVFTKLFRSNDDTRNITDKGANISPDITDINRYDRAPIYAIPTISSCFQSSGYSSSAPMNDYYNLYNENKASNTNSNNNSNINNNGNKSSQIKSVSSSLSSSTSSSSTSSSASSTCTTSSINNKTKTKSDRKYDDSNTRQIYIAPHCIRYSNSTLDDTIYRIDDDSLNEIATEILESDNLPPKLQIVYYAGKYFAINNSHLQIYKQLQLSGLITHVQADVISVEAIPFALRQHLLQTPSNSANSNEISDEEYGDELTFDNINRSGACSSSSGVSAGSSAISSHGMADILTPANIEMLNKEMLVDETYEFGTCENCLDSDNEEEDEQSNSFKILTNQNGSLKIDENLIDKIEENYLFKSYRNVEDDEDDDEECDDEDDEEDFDDDNFYNNNNNNNNEETENFNSKGFFCFIFLIKFIFINNTVLKYFFFIFQFKLEK